VIVTAAALLAAAFLAAAPAQADSGLRTQFGEVVVRNLKIGQTYSLQKMLNLPYRVVNTGDDSVNLRIDVVKLATETLKDGYDPLPSLDWVRVSTHDFIVQPNAEAVTDVIVSIPDDEALMGRRFEADLWARTQTPRGMVAVGVASKLLIQVSSQRASEEELKYKPSEHQLTNLDFTLYPAVGRADGVPVGKPVDLTKDFKCSVKLINPNDKPMRFKIQSMPNWEVLLDRPKGYVDGWDPKFVTPAVDEIEVPANSLRDVALKFEVPNEDRFYGRAFYFPIAVSVQDQEIPSRIFYKLLVRMQDRPAPETPKK
jgi:hypothetical protein